MREFEYCLRCGQPLRSWLSRQVGFGLQCWEATPPADRRRLIDVARATQRDLDTLDRTAERHLLPPWLRVLLARIWNTVGRDES